MYCEKCGNENLDNAEVCVNCGASLKDSIRMSSKSNNRNTKILAIIGVCVPIVLILLALGLGILHSARKSKGSLSESVVKVSASLESEEAYAGSKSILKTENVKKDAPDSYKHTMLLDEKNDESDVEKIKPAVKEYSVKKDFSNVTNYADYKYRDKEFFNKLLENGFVVQDGNGREFFEGYEMNRYLQIPNFVTVDSMMHTYHLYFSYLLRSIEKNYLADELADLSYEMLLNSYDQYKALKGTKWEDAALRNVAFFAIPCVLLDDAAKFPKEVSNIVKNEYEKIMDAQGFDTCEVINDFEDYSQYKPRGYYEGDKELESYFRAMMWCGRIQFTQKDEELDKSALLMTLALDDGCYEKWNSIYAVTSFFAGASDDLGYCEYMPLIDEIYGSNHDVKTIAKDEEKWKQFHKASAKLEQPRINSILVEDTQNHSNIILGYRFMGQRFSVDETIMQELVYSRVGEFEDKDKRMLPDVLDVPAALGSKTAFEILDDAGETTYKNYTKNLNNLRKEFNKDDDTIWSASLYAGWLNTLRPLLEEKGEGYPMFMQSDAWKKKDLETFAGSYTELKHDTILYSKQMMAEMGGGEEEKDFRGYVEPEPLVFSRFANLAENTSKGLKRYGYLTSEDEANLKKLAELATKLKNISIKELTNGKISDEEFDLIECYGGEIEHFWFDSMKAISGEEYPSTEKFPAALVVDIATDADGGEVLEAATGDPACIYVIVPVDGKLRIAEGSVYSFYEFVQPMSERMTDSEWRKILGIEFESYEDPFPYMQDVEHPDWVMDYRFVPNYN